MARDRSDLPAGCEHRSPSPVLPILLIGADQSRARSRDLDAADVTFGGSTAVVRGQRVEGTTKGGRSLSIEEGGYHWSGELRLWDNEVLMGWYAANDGSIRSKGTLYFVLHPHGLNMSGRWVGLGYYGRIMTGWASMGQSQEESEQTMERLIRSEGIPYVDD